ncbi:MAG: sulfatase-like hydrolase/transferase, partial [Hyphomicrobiaceae bacterium]
TQDLAQSASHAGVMDQLTTKLRAICNPEEVDQRARTDQMASIEKHGGRENILQRGDFGYSPAPGQNPEFSS